MRRTNLLHFAITLSAVPDEGLVDFGRSPCPLQLPRQLFLVAPQRTLSGSKLSAQFFDAHLVGKHCLSVIIDCAQGGGVKPNPIDDHPIYSPALFCEGKFQHR